MKTIAIIPARGGSKRLPGKNILSLGGIPLVAHSIRYALANSNIIDQVYVSTNDQNIKEIALEYGAKVVDRPEFISGDHEPTVTSLKHVLENCDGAENVVLLQPTNPLRPVRLLQECFDTFKKKHAESLFTVSRNCQKFGKIINGAFTPFNYAPGQRSQDLEPLYFENGLCYICKANVVLRNEIITENAFPFITDHIFSAVDIDTQADFDYAEYLYKTHKS